MSLEKKLRAFLKGPKKGETLELRNGLVSQYKHERKDAIQRVIQAMTVGKDVSALFPDVVKNIATYDLEQKKLVYLYLMNYAKTHPELCILAVNTFIQDTEDPNPLIRALAIRTMGCIRVAKMVDYIELPLSKKLRDDNPYVRKTAAICVAKLYDLNPDMCVEFGFVAQLKELLHDSNPSVIANALNALYEINDMGEDNALEIDAELVRSLLVCLNECTEWGRITILTALGDYVSSSPDEAYHIIERVVPQLQHANPSVVLSSIKCILAHVEKVPEKKNTLLAKLAAPLVSLVSSTVPEAQYVGLKNIRIILEQYPQVLSKELRVFFIKYSDPLYLKLEKLDILVRLANEHNCALLLGELKEYAMEFEPALVSRAVKAIGSVAVSLPAHAVRAVNLLCTLMDQRGGELIVDEAVNALVCVLRRYPDKSDLHSLVVPVIANYADALQSTEAIAGYVWVLGEHPGFFSQVNAKLEELVSGFLDYEPVLQLHVLTAVVKAQSSPGLLQRVLEVATKECNNADVRDKAYIYWRLLSSSSADASKVVQAKLPPIKSTIPSFSPQLLAQLVRELSTLSSVYHRPASTFVEPSLRRKTPTSSADGSVEDKAIVSETLLDFDEPEPAGESLIEELGDLFGKAKENKRVDDILSLFGGEEKKDRGGVKEGESVNDLVGLF